MRTRLASTLPLLLRLLLGGTLLYAGLVKVQEPGLFAQTVRAYDVLPLTLVNPFAVVIPWMELATGLCLILGLWTRSSALGAMFLLICFGAALGINLYRGADLSCGCFALNGAGGSLQAALVRDAFLMACALVLALVRSAPFSIEQLISQNFSAGPPLQVASQDERLEVRGEPKH